MKTSPWSIPPYTIDQIAKGNAILFLGSGASLGCRTKMGKEALGANALRDELCNEFLGGQAKNRTLSSVGDLVKTAAGILELQRYVASLYEPLQPTGAHLNIPKFKWKAIVTTNYDLAIERAYANSTHGLQRISPILSDDDPIGTIVSSPDQYVPLIKLHGCVSRANDQSLPFILSSWEYSRFLERRTRLFSYLKDWCYDYPIVFCGYSLADENVRDILFDVLDPTVAHKRFVLANPDVIAPEVAMWNERRVDAVPSTFDELMSYLDHAIPANQRVIAALHGGAAGPISKFIASHEQPSLDLSIYLRDKLNLVYPDMPTKAPAAADFYRGMSEGFGWLEGGLDIERSIHAELVLNTVIDKAGGKKPGPDLHLVLGYAGSGKSVALKRYAWSLSAEHRKPVLFLCEGAELDWAMIEELATLVSEPFYIVVDDIVELQADIEQCMRQAQRAAVPVTIVAGARTNEWNVDGADLVPFVTETYELLDLTDREVKELVQKLRASKSSGYMSTFSDYDAVRYLKSKLEHQLLVALHEATGGRSFSEIVASEYSQVVPTEAQKLYLDICTVHRVGVPIRAGTISRISGIRIEDFKEKLFKPLEHVVHTEFMQSAGDFVYKARHPSIALFVFDAAVPDEQSRSNQLVRIISNLNTGYSSDAEAITRLIKSKAIADDFSDKELAYPIFRAAKTACLSDEVVNQHLAQFESLHKNGDLRRALHLIDQAIASARGGRPAKSTLQVKAEILRRVANELATSSVERDKRRQDAKLILSRLIQDKRDSYPFALKAKLLLDELDGRLEEGAPTDGEGLVADLIRDIQSVLTTYRQLFSSDAHLSAIESRFATAMNEHPRAVTILEHAHKLDKHTAFLAIRLSEKYLTEGRSDEALRVLTQTLKAGGPNKDIHLAIAECYRSLSEIDHRAEISDHLRRSFSDGDSRYRARYLFARHEFLYGDRSKAKAEFAKLQKVRVSPRTIGLSSDVVKDVSGRAKRFMGVITNAPKPSYAFIRCLELDCDVYLERRVLKTSWEALRKGSSVSFSLSFSFQGPVATDARDANTEEVAGNCAAS